MVLALALWRAWSYGRHDSGHGSLQYLRMQSGRFARKTYFCDAHHIRNATISLDWPYGVRRP